MKIAAIILVIIPVIFAANSFRPFEIEKRVVGGSTIPITDSPSTVYVQVNVLSIITLLLPLTCELLCTGSIIANRWVVTAAHCTQVPNNAVSSALECTGVPNLINGTVTASPTSVSITANSATHSTDGTVYKVEGVFPHPQYNAATFNYDIALLQTTKVISVGAIIALATADPPPGTNCFVDGWGKTSGSGSGNPSTTLQRGVLVVEARSICQASYAPPVVITNQMVCANNTGVSSCNGDSGGPLSCGGLLFAVTSFGLNGCNPANPSVFASVTYADMRSFIDSKLNGP